MSINLLSLSESKLEAACSEMGLPPYRARQIYHWVAERYVCDYELMTDLSRDLRGSLSNALPIRLPSIDKTLTAEDGTIKYRLRLNDGAVIEAVRMPRGEERTTLCLSSQTGCPLRCTFCLTGKKAGRNLKTEEITGEFLRVVQGLQEQRVNVVFMGMGEPLLNLNRVGESLDFIYRSISPKRVTISTAGYPREITKLGKFKPHPRLALSFTAPTDELRRELMPVSSQYTIQELLDAVDNYPRRPGERVTIEYVMLDGINTDPVHARRMADLFRGKEKLYKFNLIPFNPVDGIPYKSPSEETLQLFLRVLIDANFTVMVRRSHGREIAAACGQLANIP